jgi:hypothetical protein
VPGASANVGLGTLPPLGNLPAQLQQGQALLGQAQTAIASGDPNAIGAMLSAGVTMAVGQTSSVVGTLVRFAMTVGSGALAGSVGGPWGAAAGAVAGAVEAVLQDVFGGGASKSTVSYPSTATAEIYKLQVQWQSMAGHVGAETQEPQGWTFADYLAAKYPIASSRYPQKLQLGLLVDSITQCAWLDQGGSGQAPPGWQPGIGEFGWFHDAMTSFSLDAPPLCTPVFFLWAQPDEIEDCDHNQFNPSPLPLAELELLWRNDSGGLQFSGPGGTMTDAMIMAHAEAARPDPFFWNSFLYWYEGSSYTFGNLETLNGMATVLGLLAVGSALKPIANELLLQQKIIHDEVGFVPPLFRLLVEEYLAKARVEEYGPSGNPKSRAAYAASVANWTDRYLRLAGG